MYEDSFIVATFFILFVIILLCVGISRLYRNSLKREDKETDIELRLLTLEHTLMDTVCKKKGIDLNKEEMKAKLTQRSKLRNRLYDEMIKEMFPDEKKK